MAKNSFIWKKKKQTFSFDKNDESNVNIYPPSDFWTWLFIIEIV